MAKFKDFGGKTEQELEPVSFQLWGEEFHCVKSIQGKVMLDMVSKSSSEDPSESAGLVTSFFDQVLLDESLERFNKLLESKDKIVTVDTLAEIVSWLTEQYTNRPSEGSQVS
jgi:hypothetical protein